MIWYLKVCLKLYLILIKILNFETVVPDQESALINIVNKYFPNIRRITCFFHYKKDLIRNRRKYGLWKDKLIL